MKRVPIIVTTTTGQSQLVGVGGVPRVGDLIRVGRQPFIISRVIWNTGTESAWEPVAEVQASPWSPPQPEAPPPAEGNDAEPVAQAAPAPEEAAARTPGDA